MSVNITLLYIHSNMRSRFFKSLLQRRELLYEYYKPYPNYVSTYSQLRLVRKFSSDDQKHSINDRNEEPQPNNLISSIGAIDKILIQKNTDIILDISEKQDTINIEDLKIEEEHYDPYKGINLERGKSGVFDIEELVLLLQKDNAQDIFVAAVPPELQYVDYIVVVTSKSNKHMKALASFIRKVYKLKKHKADEVLKIEGEKSKDWVAVDLGNIALHIFGKSARLLYDLETLWSVGPDYDENCTSDTQDIMQQYNAFLSDLEPIENNGKGNEMYEKI